MFSNQNTPSFNNSFANQGQQNSMQTSFLNKTQTTPSAFGQNNNSFSSNTPSVFGNLNTAQNPLNQSTTLFSNPNTVTQSSSLFGSTANTNLIQGQQNAPQSNLFGTNTQTSNVGQGGLYGGIGQSQNTNQTGLFGTNQQNPTQSSLFGSTSLQTQTSTTNNLFGVSQNTNQSSLFGTNQTSNRPTLFSSASQTQSNIPQSNVFGSNQNTFGNQQSGSNFAGGLSTNVNAFGTSQASNTNQFSTGLQSQGVLGQTNPTSQPTSLGFGQRPFGQNLQQSSFGQMNPQTSLGGGIRTSFGQTNQGLFGQNTQQNLSSFSSNTSQQPLIGATVSQPSTAFGQTSQQSFFPQSSSQRPLFGQQPSSGLNILSSGGTQGAFQSLNQPQTTLTQTSMFGQSSLSNAPISNVSSLSNFNTQPQQGSLFGQQTSKIPIVFPSSQQQVSSSNTGSLFNTSQIQPSTSLGLTSNFGGINTQNTSNTGGIGGLGSNLNQPLYNNQNINSWNTPQSIGGMSSNQQTSNMFSQGGITSTASSNNFFGSSSIFAQNTNPTSSSNNTMALVPYNDKSNTSLTVSSLNNLQNKEVNLFGYKQNALRFGNIDYYNSDYTQVSNNTSFVDSSIDIVNSKDMTSSTNNIDSFSSTSYDYDLKLGTYDNPNSHTLLTNCPSDTITRLRYSKNKNDILASASWDGSVNFWKTSNNLISHKFLHSLRFNYCVFDIDWNKDDRLLMGGSDGSVSMFDINTNNGDIIGNHTAPVKAVSYCGVDQPFLILSGSYDGYIKCWDIRSKACAFNYNTSSKIIDLEFHNNNIASINNKQEVVIYNFNNPLSIRYKKDLGKLSPLRSITLTNYLSSKPSEIVATIGTVNGRVFVEPVSGNSMGNNPSLVNTTSTIQKPISFKSNRQNSLVKTNEQIAYPIHDIQFNPKSKVLSCGGGDGVISVWDLQNRKPVYSSKQMKLPITSIAYNLEGDVMAYAIGYDWSRGIRAYKYQNQQPQIYIRYCKEEYNYYASKLY